jgi:hypothetical protein
MAILFPPARRPNNLQNAGAKRFRLGNRARGAAAAAPVSAWQNARRLRLQPRHIRQRRHTFQSIRRCRVEIADASRKQQRLYPVATGPLFLYEPLAVRPLRVFYGFAGIYHSADLEFVPQKSITGYNPALLPASTAKPDGYRPVGMIRT